MKRRTFAVLLLFTAVSLPVSAQDGKATDDYGVEEANNKFAARSGVLGGRTDYDYLDLKDHPDASGVPLGGIGVGNVNFSPSGRFTRIGINNIHMPVKRTEACFFALWPGKGDAAVRLVRDGRLQYGMKGAKHTGYTGLFPSAELRFDDEVPLKPEIRAWSGLVPHNTKDSSLPVVWFEVSLTSPDDREVAVAFSWEDFIGLFRDPASTDGMDGQVLQAGRNRLCNGEEWPDREKAATRVAAYRAGKLTGFVQYAPEPLEPRRYTFQNYVDRVVVAVEQAPGQDVSVLPAFDVTDGGAAWEAFRQNGDFGDFRAEAPLSAAAGRSKASALAVKTRLKAGRTKTIRFALAWYCPEIRINASVSKDRYWADGGDYNKYYHNFFTGMDDLLEYAARNRERIGRETLAWQQPVMESTLPDWYKFKLINSGYVIYTNMVLNKKGDVMVNEGAMGGLAGTMDQRISAHPFYQKFFTQLDRSEMDIFADAMDPEGYILHFIGHYYVGMGTVGGRVPTEKGHMLDNSSGWIIQLVKDYQQTGDAEYLTRHAAGVKRAMEYLKSCCPEGSLVPVGKTTYDDYSHPPLYSYYAGVWLATLKACEVFGEAMGDAALAAESRDLFARSREEIIRKLWNGRFFAYGCEPDGSKRLDCVLFTGQLAGQFLSRYCGWGDIYPMEMVKASLVSQFKISLSKTPDYYANKVWDINLGRGIDWPQSQCWPFYLESYTGLAGIQAGFCADGMDILKHIQLVHLRQGWTWTQNLWNPSDITYMTAPVTWFSPDVLAGAGVDIPRRELRLSPVVGNEKVVLPLYFPTFWATLTADPATRRLTLEITRTFGERRAVFDKVIAEPAGRPASERREVAIEPFDAVQGRVLDLSLHWSEIVDPALEEAVLPVADEMDFRYVQK